MSQPTFIALPPQISEPFEVFINGVLQEPGTDFEVRGRTLVFPRSLNQRRSLGRIRRLFLVFAGNYQEHEAVDVAYKADGRRIVATSLESQRQ